MPAEENPYRRALHSSNKYESVLGVSQSESKRLAEEFGIHEHDVLGPGLSGQALHNMLLDSHTDGFRAGVAERQKQSDAERELDAHTAANAYDEGYDKAMREATERDRANREHRAHLLVGNLRQTLDDLGKLSRTRSDARAKELEKAITTRVRNLESYVKQQMLGIEEDRG